MPIFYNSGAPTPSTKNNITDIAVTYGIRDFLLTKNLAPVYPTAFNLSPGTVKIGEPILDTMVGTGNVTTPFGLPLETEGILRWQIATILNRYKDDTSTSGILQEIIDYIPPTQPAWPNSVEPQGSGSYPQNIDKYGLLAKMTESGARKNATLMNLYLDADRQVDTADGLNVLYSFPQQIKGYLDTYGGLNLGGSGAVQAANIIGSVLNGQGLGLAKGGVVTNFDVRSSLAGRVLGATGLINDTKLGSIGAQQLALALANNAAFNVQQAAFGALNLQDNVLSLVKNGTLAGFRPNYQITVPAGTGGRILDYAGKILGFTLPKSYLQDAGSVFLSESNSANIERANAMILNTGKGQVQALITNMFANINGTGQYDNPDSAPFRSGYVPGYKDNKGREAINPNLYAFYNSDKSTIYNFLINTKGIIPEINWNRSNMIKEYGFTGPEENFGVINPYESSTIKRPTFTWGSDVGGTVNSENSPFGGNIVEPYVSEFKKKNLLAKTQMLFDDKGMKNIVSGFGDINSSIKASQLQTAVVGGGISKGSAVMSGTKFDANGRYTGELDTPVNTYCRTWTTNLRYDSVTNLIRNNGLSSVVPYRFQMFNSTLDQYGFPKIAPYSTDSFSIADPKNYMFSIENLAWAEDWPNLLPCEQGFGDMLGGKRGRLMWFPPYNIQFSESSNVNWEATSFIGRGESIYTYNNTERAGNLSFSIIVDHPSYINSFRGQDGPDDAYVASFFAGCVDPSSEFADKLTVSEKSSVVEKTITIPQKKNVEPQKPPPSFTIYFPNDVDALNSKYENGLSGSTTADTIDYNINPSGNGFGLGDYPGSFTSSGPWLDRTNYGLNGKKSPIVIDGVTYNGFSDPLFISALNEYLTTKCQACRVQVAGYASKQGNATANQKLADARANSVIASLKPQLFFGFSPDEKEKRFKKLPSEPVDSTGCNPKTGSDTDVEACKVARKAVVSFVFDETLLPKELTDPVPVEKKVNQRVNTKIKNRLYTECSYFEQLTDKDAFVFDKFREKIKYFHPAFHSTTPEGLNSRLTFLHQCTRQGPTLETQGANNLAFGRPPVCILRIGDFYNTKIVIDNLNIDYEPLVWDLNPEGIGVQPMIANVTISFKFIGASSLVGPINKLQNALSFNFYANTQVYDPRADYIAKRTGDLEGRPDDSDKDGTTALKPWVLKNGVTNINSLIEKVDTPLDIIDNTPTLNQVAESNKIDANSKPADQPSSTATTDEAIYSNAQILQKYQISLGYDGTKIKGYFLIYYENDLLENEYDAKLQLQAGEMGGFIDIASFKIGSKNNGKAGRGDFISTKDGWKQTLDFAKTPKDYNVIFRVIIPKFPKIAFWDVKVIIPYDCPGMDFKLNDIISETDYKYIKERPCCACYDEPYTAKSPYIIEGKECPLSGTTC